MGIPEQDRLDYVCRQDMNEIERAVTDIKAAMKRVDAMMPHTWIGKKADTWRTDHEGRMKRLKTLFDSFPAEENRLVGEAQKKQSAQDRKMHGAS
ncbi:hypothetical protein OHA44_15840 [Streptomyces sp. NBC_00144]|uniref:hypothetical protein n=1 Tax=Streptomyces sp. NBC_00144 TaxID=2975665 RepID=UPI0032453BE5